jgi:hypothetical protein
MAETELAKTDPASLPLKDTEVTYNTLKALINTPTVPMRYRQSQTGVNDMLAAVLIGKELGIGPMEAIGSLYLVNGQAAMSGKLMSALVHRAGHQIRLKVESKKVTATAWRRDPYTHRLEEVGSISFGDVEAKRAKLHEKDTYKAYPQIMWGWRAVSALCRFYFADVISGTSIYVPDELDIEAKIEPISEDIEILVEGEALAIENATAEVVDVLDAEVVVDK